MSKHWYTSSGKRALCSSGKIALQEICPCDCQYIPFYSPSLDGSKMFVGASWTPWLISKVDDIENLPALYSSIVDVVAQIRTQNNHPIVYVADGNYVGNIDLSGTTNNIKFQAQSLSATIDGQVINETYIHLKTFKGFSITASVEQFIEEEESLKYFAIFISCKWDIITPDGEIGENSKGVTIYYAYCCEIDIQTGNGGNGGDASSSSEEGENGGNSGSVTITASKGCEIDVLIGDGGDGGNGGDGGAYERGTRGGSGGNVGNCQLGVANSLLSFYRGSGGVGGRGGNGGDSPTGVGVGVGVGALDGGNGGYGGSIGYFQLSGSDNTLTMVSDSAGNGGDGGDGGSLFDSDGDDEGGRGGTGGYGGNFANVSIPPNTTGSVSYVSAGDGGNSGAGGDCVNCNPGYERDGGYGGDAGKFYIYSSPSVFTLNLPATGGSGGSGSPDGGDGDPPEVNYL